MQDRIQNLVQALPSEFQGAIITSAENRFYFLGMKSSAGTLVLVKEKAYFIIDFRYKELADKTIKNATVILQDKLYQQIEEIFRAHNVNKVWLEDSLSIGTYTLYTQKMAALSFCLQSPLTKHIEGLRAVKSTEEIQCIEKAQAITDAAFAHMCTVLKAGKTEKEMAIELEHFMKKQGATDLAFSSILVSGTNSSLPHGVPSEKVIQNGDFVTMDFGAKFGGYCTDMTRTVAIGSASEEMKKVYNTVLTAQLKALDAIKEGAVCQEIDKIARDYIYENGYEGKFGHGLGHSLGIEIHESPRFAAGNDTLLKAGMMMTVEPGIYLENQFGVRIEDTICVTKDGLINLAKSPKELLVL